MTKATWNTERERTLRQLWNIEKLSASEIARRLGGEITASAVIGKAHRMKLMQRDNPIPALKRKKPRKKFWGSGDEPTVEQLSEKEKKRMKILEEMERNDTIAVQTSTGGKQLIDLDAFECRFPIGDPKKAGFHFCGKPAIKLFGYCADCDRRAHASSQAPIAKSFADID